MTLTREPKLMTDIDNGPVPLSEAEEAELRDLPVCNCGNPSCMACPTPAIDGIGADWLAAHHGNILATIAELRAQADRRRVIFDEALESLKMEPVHLVLFVSNVQCREKLAAAESTIAELRTEIRDRAETEQSLLRMIDADVDTIAHLRTVADVAERVVEGYFVAPGISTSIDDLRAALAKWKGMGE